MNTLFLYTKCWAVSSWHNGDLFNQVIKPLNKGSVIFNEATILRLTVVVSIEVLNWEMELSNCLLLWSKWLPAPCELRIACKIVMVSFHLDCSDRGLYWFLPCWNHYRHKGASFSSLPSFFIKDLHSCCLHLCVNEDVLLLLHTLQQLMMIQNTIINGFLQWVQ